MCTLKQKFGVNGNVVAKIITELMCFEPEVCICNGNELEMMRGSVSVMRDFLLTFPQICLCNRQQFFSQHELISVIGNQFLPEERLSVINLDTTVHEMRGL